MSNPLFRPGETIISDRLMGKITYAYRDYDDKQWKYILDPATENPPTIWESEVVSVWRENRWTGK